MNPKKNPGYDSHQILLDLMHDAVTVYKERKSLHQVADELDLNPIKVRKLLITAGAYESETADKIKRLNEDGETIQGIMSAMNLSQATIYSYLPYRKVPYKADELSANAERVKKYRERQAACEKLRDEGGMDNLWSAIVAFAGYPFYTSKGLKFTYTVKGGEIKVNRKEKSVTRSSVEMAYRKTMEGEVTGPKKLGVFGSSYLYPVFLRLGVV